MNGGSETVARLDEATMRYGATVALRQVSLEIERGRVIALLGPNGAGKTTSVKLLLGLVSPTSGTATLFGGDPRKAASRRRIGAMLQVGKVPETLRVREHIDQFRGYYPAPLPVKDVLELGGLEEIYDRKFGDLSVARRVAMADDAWLVPPLWRSEFRSVLRKYLLRGELSVERCIEITFAAEARLSEGETQVSSAEVIKLVAASGCSAYDAEYISLARSFSVPLVTSDRRLCASFPAVAISPADFLSAHMGGD